MGLSIFFIRKSQHRLKGQLNVVNLGLGTSYPTISLAMTFFQMITLIMLAAELLCSAVLVRFCGRIRYAKALPQRI